MVTLKRRASNLFPYGHLYSFIHSVDCTAQFWCPTTEVYTFIYYFGPCMKNLKGEGNFSSYFDNGDVVLHIFAKFRIWNWLRRNIVVRKNQLFLYCYTKLSLSRRTGNQYLSSWNNLLNNFLSGLMFQYSFLLKSITCINYLIA